MRARLYQQAAFVYQFAPAHERVRTYASLAVELATAHGLYEVAARAYSVLYTITHDEDDDPIATLAILDKLEECARKGASRQARVFGLIASYAVEVERGDVDAMDRIERELDDRAVPASARAQGLLPAHAMRYACEGDFRRAYDQVAGTAQTQASDERRALRGAEIALYAFAAGLQAEGDEALRDASAALDRCTRPSLRIVRSHLVLALAELVRGRSSAAHRAVAEAEKSSTPQMRRLRALAHAVRAMERVQLGQAEPATLAAALERLRAEHFGGMARSARGAARRARRRAGLHAADAVGARDLAAAREGREHEGRRQPHRAAARRPSTRTFARSAANSTAAAAAKRSRSRPAQAG